MSELQVSKWYSKVVFCSFNCSLDDLKDFWKFEVESNFVKNWKFHDRGPERNFGFWPLFEHCISDLWVNCRYQNCILKCSLVDLKDLCKFEVESKFCQKLKIFMTAVLSEISDFDHFLNIVISDLWVNCKFQTCIRKWSFVDLKDLWKFEVVWKFCQ